ncbi:GH25073 [Drosophila grimshawi]|uniref:GH10619 n=1 Tax=Drosophila grimshawi TaxID=7222 RepID=B4K3T5_DROGR|nr:GH10619 [Drosophila grimshawi]EDW04338.1 GH25073 [Drosophila grimshawi]
MSVYLWLLLISIGVVSEERHFKFIFDRLTVKHFGEIVEELNYSLIQLNNRSYISANLLLKRDMYKIVLNTTMDFWNMDNKKTRLYRMRIDPCIFLEQIHKNRFVNMFTKSLFQHTAGQLTCPLKGKFNYTLNNWYMDEMDFPAFWPFGTFQAKTDISMDTKKTFNIMLRGRVAKK